ncbi:hypothetical protein [Sulfurimonas sp.]|uniref:hypothetical protein n=1 Tax=Sulfurimonas sp. TaxID=2022749 RepID=UPI002AB1AAB4|nr:hypothetical protein [Sulfurimonas sp.]
MKEVNDALLYKYPNYTLLPKKELVIIEELREVIYKDMEAINNRFKLKNSILTSLIYVVFIVLPPVGWILIAVIEVMRRMRKNYLKNTRIWEPSFEIIDPLYQKGHNEIFDKIKIFSQAPANEYTNLGIVKTENDTEERATNTLLFKAYNMGADAIINFSINSTSTTSISSMDKQFKSDNYTVNTNTEEKYMAYGDAIKYLKR